MYANERHSKVHVGKHLLDEFLIQNGLIQRDALLTWVSSRIQYRQPHSPIHFLFKMV
jgi:hypothetical protein